MLNRNYVAMKVDFLFSEDFYGMNAPELKHTCMHMLCMQGEGSFVFNEHCYHIVKNDLVVMPYPHRARNLAAHPDMKVEWFAADYKFLQNQLPSNNYSIGGSISLNHNPVIPLSEEHAVRILDDFHRLRERMENRQAMFYREMMGSLCLTMMYDIFESHSQRDNTSEQSDRTGYIVKRSVNYYAESLNVSPKYLSTTIKRLTGHSVTSFIDRATVPILKNLLEDERMSLTQIAERMNFASLSYFSRYCTKHLGMPPSDYRRSHQPKIK